MPNYNILNTGTNFPPVDVLIDSSKIILNKQKKKKLLFCVLENSYWTRKANCKFWSEDWAATHPGFPIPTAELLTDSLYRCLKRKVIIKISKLALLAVSGGKVIARY